MAPSEPKRVYAIVDADSGGLYRSDDRGAHWTRTSYDTRIWQRGWYFGGITVEPGTPTLSTPQHEPVPLGRWRQDVHPDQGHAAGDDYHTLWIDPENPDRRILGTDQGAVVTPTAAEAGVPGTTSHSADLPRVHRQPVPLLGLRRAAGLGRGACPAARTGSDGINLTQFREITAGGESQNIVPDPRDPEASTGERSRRSTCARCRRSRWTRPSPSPTSGGVPGHCRSPSPAATRASSTSRTRSSSAPRTAGGTGRISPDLTREDPGRAREPRPRHRRHDLRLGPRRGVVYALAPSRLADRDLWAAPTTAWSGAPATRVGLGERHARGARALVQGRQPRALPFDAETAYAGDRSASTRRPAPTSTAPAMAGALDPRRERHPGRPSSTSSARIRCAGAFCTRARSGASCVAFDDGDHWQWLKAGLPVTSVRDLDVHEDDLVIATHGRGIWILDGVGPLRQVSPEVPTAPAWLFEPAKTYRVRPAHFTGTPMPKDEPTTPNPPEGAGIDYALGADAAQPVTLEVHDAAGQLVQHWSSADTTALPDPAHMRTAPQWMTPPQRLGTTAGMHRFTWSLHYAPQATTGVATRRGNEGVWAPPGDYTVTLNVEGRSLTRTLTLVCDPRVKLEPAAFQEQFELGRRIELGSARLARATDAARQDPEAAHGAP